MHNQHAYCEHADCDNNWDVKIGGAVLCFDHVRSWLKDNELTLGDVLNCEHIDA